MLNSRINKFIVDNWNRKANTIHINMTECKFAEYNICSAVKLECIWTGMYNHVVGIEIRWLESNWIRCTRTCNNRYCIFLVICSGQNFKNNLTAYSFFYYVLNFIINCSIIFIILLIFLIITRVLVKAL